MKKIIIASKNMGKLAELEAPLKALGFEVGLLPENYPDIVEDGHSFEENALIKARFVCKDLGMPALADDSGLCVDALEGDPGIYSARYAHGYRDVSIDVLPIKKESQDEKNNRKLLDKMQAFKGRERTCAFHCAMALVFPSGQNSKKSENVLYSKEKSSFGEDHERVNFLGHSKIAFDLAGQEIVVHEKWEGILLETPCGDNGFGYDPLFFDEELQCASAQMPKEVKMKRSHRGKALNALFDVLKKKKV